MKTFALAAMTLLFASSAFAHLELGTYKGKNGKGEDCSFEVRSIDFVMNIRHPLNERVTVAVGNEKLVFSHTPKVDVDKGTVLFDGENLTTVIGVPGQGYAWVLKMSHEEGHEGPVSLTYLGHHYKSGEKSKEVCAGLKHVN